MQKDPSIHIKKSDLIKVLKSLPFFLNEPNNDNIDFEELADDILKKGKRYTVSSRFIIVKDSSTLKKAVNTTRGDTEYAFVFVKQLTLYRRSLRHHLTEKYDENHKDWGSVKKLAEQVKAFCTQFDLAPEAGSLFIIKTLHQKTSKFIIPFWINNFDYLVNMYTALEYIKNDPTPQLTKEAYKVYQQQLIDHIGQVTKYEDKPLDYQHFVKVVEASKEIGCKTEDYIKAQFRALEWKNTYPEPMALNYPKAREYVLKYLFENNIVINKNQNPIEKINWANIKKARV